MSAQEENSWCDCCSSTSSSEWSSTSGICDVRSFITAEFVRFISAHHGSRKRCTVRRLNLVPPASRKLSLWQRLMNALKTDPTTCEVSSLIVDGIVAGIRDQADHVHAAAVVVHHLSDPNNTALRRDVLDGRIPPEKLASMQECDLVNPILREKWEKQRCEVLRQKTVEFVERLTSTVTTIYTCPSCGEKQCTLRERQADKQKWAGDDATPFLLTCCSCSLTFRR
ncbi:Transcription elongation factor S-II [Trypanosoma melophagium]|uniref:Transcription elongation factor S-II n=1 Tax=Trypanosoma melophagium TaxID=715481 RepID=UPI00351A8527|nr:Transcription elongation factor S-II [Trypanosoma melophagium]